MYEYRLAYRHTDGEVEGFVGRGLTREGAAESALTKILEKVSSIGDKFNKDNVYKNKDKLSAREMEQVRVDWSFK